MVIIPDTDGCFCKRLRRYLNNSRLISLVNTELLKGYRAHSSDRHHVDAMAWLCNILGASGKKIYRPTLQEVVNNAPSKKLVKFAEKNLNRLSGS